MACFRCSTCGINYPYAMKHRECEVCGGRTDGVGNDEADPNWAAMVDLALGLKSERDQFSRRGLVLEQSWDELATRLHIPPSFEVFAYALDEHDAKAMFDAHPVEFARDWKPLNPDEAT